MRSVFDQIVMQPPSDDEDNASGDGEDVNWAAFGRDLKSLQRWYASWLGLDCGRFLAPCHPARAVVYLRMASKQRTNHACFVLMHAWYSPCPCVSVIGAGNLMGCRVGHLFRYDGVEKDGVGGVGGKARSVVVVIEVILIGHPGKVLQWWCTLGSLGSAGKSYLERREQGGTS